MTRVWLIRHGQTDWNLEGRWQGQTGSSLNARGEAQAAQLARVLAPVGLEAIVSSDLSRAHQTARAIAIAAKLRVQLDARLREIDQGEWEGKHLSEIVAQCPDAMKRRREQPLTACAPGGETVLQVQTRVLEAVRDIARTYPNESVAIVSHGLALAIVRAEYEGYPIEAIWDLVPDNGEVIEIIISP